MATATEAITSPGGTSEDALLGGRVRLLQPLDGYRVAIDPLLLAAALSARDGEAVVDLGSGTGAVALCVAARLPGVRMTGIERDPHTLALARESARLNRFDGHVTFEEGDIRTAPALLAGKADHVIANPPFMEPGRGTLPPNPGRQAAAFADGTCLDDWIGSALALLRRGGSATFIHRADRLDALVSGLTADAGEITVFPLWPRAGVAARRVLVRARKGLRGGARMLPGLVLHRDDGDYTAAARAVLADAAPLDLTGRGAL